MAEHYDTRCPFCGKFIDPDAEGTYFDTGERGADPEFCYVAPFCNEQHAKRFHGEDRGAAQA